MVETAGDSDTTNEVESDDVTEPDMEPDIEPEVETDSVVDALRLAVLLTNGDDDAVIVGVPVLDGVAVRELLAPALRVND